jgi:tetratricopeptide (TPR) repeat protein
MRRVAPLILIAVLLLAGGEARASDQSKRLASRGLVDFHAGRYAKALELFDQAVAADSQDARALYYRAMTRERLDDVNGAIGDLRAALTAEPDFDEAALELGVALVQTGQYQEATPPLEQARHLADQDGQASLFLGIAQLRLDQTAAALVNFERAAKDPKWTRAARYYQGVATYRLGDWDQADQHFSAVASESPNSDMGREAAAFLAKIHQGEVANYQLYGAVGFQYDSNVVLAPSSGAVSDQLAISQLADGRASLDVGGC